MLNSFRDVPQQEAEFALATIADMLMPKPQGFDEPGFFQSKADPALVEKAYEEFLQKLKIQSTSLKQVSQLTEQDKGKLYKYISKEFYNINKIKDKEEEIRQRLGQEGLLSPHAYVVKIPSEIKPRFKQLGVSEKEVRQTILKCDFVEHMFPLKAIGLTERDFTLFSKNYDLKKKHPYALLVVAYRGGVDLTPHLAVKVYLKEVDTSDCQSLVDVWRKFADKFGDPIKANNIEKKFFFNERFNSSEKKEFFDFIDGAPKSPNHVFFSIERKEPISGNPTSVPYDVGFALQINLDKYLPTLTNKD